LDYLIEIMYFLEGSGSGGRGSPGGFGSAGGFARSGFGSGPGFGSSSRSNNNDNMEN
jgi:hypothetical protein